MKSRTIPLGYLVPRWQIGIEIVFSVKARYGLDICIQSHDSSHSQLYAFGIQTLNEISSLRTKNERSMTYRKSSGQCCVKRRHMRIGFVVVIRRIGISLKCEYEAIRP